MSTVRTVLTWYLTEKKCEVRTGSGLQRPVRTGTLFDLALICEKRLSQFQSALERGHLGSGAGVNYAPFVELGLICEKRLRQYQSALEREVLIVRESCASRHRFALC